MARVTYSKSIPDPERVMEEIARTRSVLIQAGTKVRPFGPAYHMLHVVVTGIDALATYLTGERHYFGRQHQHLGISDHARPGLDIDKSPHETPEELSRYIGRD